MARAMAQWVLQHCVCIYIRLAQAMLLLGPSGKVTLPLGIYAFIYRGADVEDARLGEQ